MTPRHDRCALTGASLALAFTSGALLSPWLLPLGMRAGEAAAGWLIDHIEIRRVL